MDKSTNSPIKNAIIKIIMSSDNIQPVKSDDNGIFQINMSNNDLNNGGIEIAIEAEGYQTRVSRVSPKPQNDKIYLTPSISLPPPPKNPPIVSIPRTGYDNDGRQTKLVFHSLIGSSGGTMTWKHGSIDTLDNSVGGKEQKAEDFLKEKFKQSGIKESIKNAYQLFVLGVASCEGNTDDEQERARQRGKILQEQLKEISSVGTQVLLLGKYKDCPNGQVSAQRTKNQRSVVIISVQNRDEGVNFEQSIINAFKSAHIDKEFQADLKSYLRNSNASSPLGSLDVVKYSCFKVGVDPTCSNNSP